MYGESRRRHRSFDLTRSAALGGLDVLAGVGLGVCAGVACYLGWQLVDLSLLQTYDLWFEGDLERVYRNITERWSDHRRSNVHPLFALFATPTAYGLRAAFGLTAFETVRLLSVALAGLWTACLYAFLRLLGCRRFDAALFTLLGAVSSAAVFWFTLPETYAWGSLTILLAFIVVALGAKYELGELPHVLASALTLSVTVTNWMAGLAIAIARFPWRRALQISVNALCLVVVLWAVQKAVVPNTVFFLGGNDERRFVHLPSLTEAGHVAAVLLLHSIVMPDISVVSHPEAIRVAGDRIDALCRALSIQTATLRSSDPWVVSGSLMWVVLLALGVWSLGMGRVDPGVRVAIVLCLMGQVALHAVYGPETFLYSLNILPLLIATAAFGTLGRARPLVLSLCAVLIAIAAGRNVAALQHAIHLANTMPAVETPTVPDALHQCRQDLKPAVLQR